MPWKLTDQPFGRCSDAPSLRFSAWQGRCHCIHTAPWHETSQQRWYGYFGLVDVL